MDTKQTYRRLIEEILIGHTKIPYAHGDIQFETVFDREQDRYLLMILGREKVGGDFPSTTRRVHGCLLHIDIINGKIWIQRDGTEYGVANQLVEAGVPKEHIVLGFRDPEFRKITDFAVT
ncbi:XisI protein [Aerosakkonema funiforme]|uniref:XisI protein n=1 Tax=Aerosakkonema funiforme TaxID=1246630 RepID=UPI0035BB3C2B